MKTFLLNGVNVRARENDSALYLFDIIATYAGNDPVSHEPRRNRIAAHMATKGIKGHPDDDETPAYLELLSDDGKGYWNVVKPEYLSDVITGMEPPVEWKAEFWEAYAEFLRSKYVGPRPVTVASESDTNKSDNHTAFDPDLEEAIVLINAEQIRRDDQRALLTKKLAKVLTPTRHIPKEVRSRSGSLQDWKYELRKLHIDREALEYQMRYSPIDKENYGMLKAQKHALDAQIWELSDAISNSKENEGTNV